MISQADIIRTLVNKNCTDESIMSMALSPDCTPPKLLEKFTEAERYDLALDLSMKLGLDVLPLWKTWAKQCLRNRNFQGARDKFRHCFLRLRASSGRCNTAASGLLTEIVEELTKMEETKLTLAEEIQLIKQRKSTIRSSPTQAAQGDMSVAKINTRPKIYEECLYYIDEYGNSQDKIRFYLRNSLLDEATSMLLHDKKLNIEEKFFILDVVLYLTTTGQLDKFVSALLKADPNVTSSMRYFRTIYNFCTTHRRFNLLYYFQTRVSDFVEAANNQINNFFLRKPVQSYRELNGRLASLMNARANYQSYLTRVSRSENVDDQNGKKPKNCDQSQQTHPGIFSQMSPNEVGQQLKLIDLQIELTRNFAINEVSGCMNGLEVVGIFDNAGDQSASSDDRKPSKGNFNLSQDVFPVTLFDKTEQRRTFLAALLLIYFDVTCSSYFSKSGLEMANQVVEIFGLDKLKVFKTAMRVIIEDESCDILENSRLLLERLKEDYLNFVKTSTVKSIADRKAPRRAAKTVAKSRRTNDHLLSNDDAPPLRTTSPSGPSKSLSAGPKQAAFKTTALGEDHTHKTTSLPLSVATDRAPQSIADPKSHLRPDSATTSTTLTSLADATSNEASAAKSGNILMNRVPLSNYHMATSNSKNSSEAARMLCDEVIRDSIKSCREPDYKMELAKLLSAEAKIELYIELGKLSNAQSLACSMNRPDYVSIIIDEAARLNQDHVKTVCQHWLVKRS